MNDNSNKGQAPIMKEQPVKEKLMVTLELTASDILKIVYIICGTVLATVLIVCSYKAGIVWAVFALTAFLAFMLFLYEGMTP